MWIYFCVIDEISEFEIIYEIERMHFGRMWRRAVAALRKIGEKVEEKRT